LAERRALDVIEHGDVKTNFLHFGETLKFYMCDAEGQTIFGAIEHKVVKA